MYIRRPKTGQKNQTQDCLFGLFSVLLLPLQEKERDAAFSPIANNISSLLVFLVPTQYKKAVKEERESSSMKGTFVGLRAQARVDHVPKAERRRKYGHA